MNSNVKSKIIAACVGLFISVIAFIVGYTYAAQPAQISQIVTNDEILDYTLVYVQLFSFDGTMVYDTTTGTMRPLASATYANTAITVTVNATYGVGILNTIPLVSDIKLVRRFKGSSDATADVNDTMLWAADAIYIDKNGTWSSWNGPEIANF